MGQKKIPQPTGAELEILQVLWESGTCSVQHINNEMNRHRDVGYTTTLKHLQIMVKKNLVKRRKLGMCHMYVAVNQEKETRGQLLDSLIQTAFGGSVQKLILQALGHHTISREDLDQIHKVISELKNDEANDQAPNDKVPNDKVPNDKVPNDKVPNDKVPNDKAPNGEALNGEALNGEALNGEASKGKINIDARKFGC
jgi:BlaI family transcriptional regulator, penicillinase repressor